MLREQGTDLGISGERTDVQIHFDNLIFPSPLNDSPGGGRMFHCFLFHQGIYDTLKEILEEDDFTEGIYWRTFGDIGDLWQNAGHVFPADLVSRFEDAKEQKQVTEIFAVQLPTENGADMEKAINEQVKRLKRTKIDHLTANAATVEEIQRLVDAKRKLDSLYITI